MREAVNFFTIISADYGVILERMVDMFDDDANHIVGCEYDDFFPVQDDISVTSDFDQEPCPSESHIPTHTACTNLTKAWKYWANIIYLVGQFPSFDKYKYQLLTWANKDGRCLPADEPTSRGTVTINNH